MSETPTPASPSSSPANAQSEGADFQTLTADSASTAPVQRNAAVYGRVDGKSATARAVASAAEEAALVPQSPILAELIDKNRDKLADQAATTLKVLFGTAYANVPQEEMEARLYDLLEAMGQIARSGAIDPDHIADFASSVLVGPQFEGFNARDMTNEALRAIDMVINGMIDQKLLGEQNTQSRADSRALLARVIHEAREIVTGTPQ